MKEYTMDKCQNYCDSVAAVSAIAEGSFVSCKVASTGHAVIDPNGEVVAWTVDGYWAAIIVALLNCVEHSGLSDVSPHAASGMGASADLEATEYDDAG